jgi:hypothetical protein
MNGHAKAFLGAAGLGLCALVACGGDERAAPADGGASDGWRDVCFQCPGVGLPPDFEGCREVACGGADRALAPSDAAAGRATRWCEYNEATGVFDRNCVHAPPGGGDGGPATREAWCTPPRDGGAPECTFYGDTPHGDPQVCIYCSGARVDPQTGRERCLRVACGPSAADAGAPR